MAVVEVDDAGRRNTKNPTRIGVGLCGFRRCSPTKLVNLILIEDLNIFTVEIQSIDADQGFHHAVRLQTIQGGQVCFYRAEVFYADGFDDLGQEFLLQMFEYVTCPEIVVLPKAERNSGRLAMIVVLPSLLGNLINSIPASWKVSPSWMPG